MEGLLLGLCLFRLSENCFACLPFFLCFSSFLFFISFYFYFLGAGPNGAFKLTRPRGHKLHWTTTVIHTGISFRAFGWQRRTRTIFNTELGLLFTGFFWLFNSVYLFYLYFPGPVLVRFHYILFVLLVVFDLYSYLVVIPTFCFAYGFPIA
ncbi:hypothetical protein P170DRAFT_221969 [Aspergillus steynii IBT 23096]|uniref:Uncharacterized protein n=1 Tax=Aspergillus steynii IBT 23096 TaxID=1392250 RepID=A0A2I2G1M7_9EURO|nr:uncharacterized protein P170DRAFT_221969 [Aspergillus steynii IBT 23096]PLB46779.1 hypothetical protein P170DRAFT_221969 [Aspergillus steynii IBT 23096]